eukprot:5207964-Pyramimonas_sp.AAC.1
MQTHVKQCEAMRSIAKRCEAMRTNTKQRKILRTSKKQCTAMRGHTKCDLRTIGVVTKMVRRRTAATGGHEPARPALSP